MIIDLILFPIKSAFLFAGMVIGILIFLFWIWMIVDCALRNFRNNAEKIVWLIVIILFGWIGALIYLFVIFFGSPRGLARRR